MIVFNKFIMQIPYFNSILQLTNTLQFSNTDSKQQLVKIEVQQIPSQFQLPSPFVIEDHTYPGWFGWLSLIGVPVAVFLGSYAFTNYLEREQKKKNKTLYAFEIIKEWESESMRECREKAYEKFVLDTNEEGLYVEYDKNDNDSDKKEPKVKSIIEMYYDRKKKKTEDNIKDYGNIFRIINFFERVNILIKKEIIDQEIIYSLLSDDLYAWDNKYFKIQRRYHRNYLKKSLSPYKEKIKTDGWNSGFGPYLFIYDKKLIRDDVIILIILLNDTIRTAKREEKTKLHLILFILNNLGSIINNLDDKYLKKVVSF